MLYRILALRTIFGMLLTIWFAYGVWEARNYAFLAKVFPFSISIVLLICSIIYLIQEILTSARMDKGQAHGFADLSTSWNMPIQEVWRRFFNIVLMILVIYGFIWLIGYPLTIWLFILIFYRFVAGASWWGSAVAALTGLGFLVLTSQILNMQWPEGLIHLPWPLG